MPKKIASDQNEMTDDELQLFLSDLDSLQTVDRDTTEDSLPIQKSFHIPIKKIGYWLLGILCGLFLCGTLLFGMFQIYRNQNVEILILQEISRELKTVNEKLDQACWNAPILPESEEEMIEPLISPLEHLNVS